jgi:hypothetical protein
MIDEATDRPAAPPPKTFDANMRETTARPFQTIPDRAPLREVRGQPTAEAEMKQAAMALGQARIIDLRSQARRDAVIAVSRARERAGFPRTGWTRLEADTLHAITDLLLQVQGQEIARQIRGDQPVADEPFKDGA